MTTTLTGFTRSAFIPSGKFDLAAHCGVADVAGLRLWIDPSCLNESGEYASKVGAGKLTPVGTVVVENGPGYLGRESTIRMTGPSTRMDLTGLAIPTTGIWCMYVAAHALSRLLLVGGAKLNLGNLIVTCVHDQLRMRIAWGAGGASTAQNTGINFASRPAIICFGRKTAGSATKLFTKIRTFGGNWIENVAADFCTTTGLEGGTPRSIDSAFSFGAHGETAGYVANSRISEVIMTDAQSPVVESYLSIATGFE